MKQEEAHEDTSRIGTGTAQRVFLRYGNHDLVTPLDWRVYGGSYPLDYPSTERHQAPRTDRDAGPPATLPGPS